MIRRVAIMRFGWGILWVGASWGALLPAVESKSPDIKTKQTEISDVRLGTETKLESRLSFSGLKLQGQLKKPDLSYIYRRRGLKAEQIVNIPEDFNDEISQDAGRF